MRDWLGEARRDPYRLRLDSGELLVVDDPHTVEDYSVLDFARLEDPACLVVLLGERSEQAWSELRAWTVDELHELTEDIFAHYGAERARLPELAWLVEDYGNEIEADLREWFGRDLLDLFRGELTVNTVANLVRILRVRRNSYLSWAMVNDPDLYRESAKQRPSKPSKRDQQPETFEWGLLHDMLSSNLRLMQQLVHETRVHGTKSHNKKAKIENFPPPRTAKERVERAEARRAAEHIDSMLVFAEHVTDEQHNTGGSADG